MPQEVCEQHAELVKNDAEIIRDIAVIKNDISYIRNKVCNHVEEGEKDGGWRDRLLLLEQSVSELKKAMWWRVFTAGVVGGLVGGKLAPDVMNYLLKLVLK